MKVDEKTTKYKTEHMGKTYYSCASGCKKPFEENPHKYMKMLEKHLGWNLTNNLPQLFSF